ncbi:hypothetical protein WJX72_010242 [[Myrmecia] bisecta]|uniref:Uncharacterized protein n=1 Tax=[Myrmecia] bisecta TaxID=41462 RepID=A0AAW1PQ81_9CHLO
MLGHSAQSVAARKNTRKLLQELDAFVNGQGLQASEQALACQKQAAALLSTLTERQPSSGGNCSIGGWWLPGGASHKHGCVSGSG